jgi:hypothetical protein
MEINISAAVSSALESEIPGLLYPAEEIVGYFLACFQSLQLPSTQKVL